MDDVYIEAILLWTNQGPSPLAERWLQQHGLDHLPMQAGLLVTGSRAQFEAAFGVDLSQARRPISLPIPPELRGVVASIVIPVERTYS